MPAGVRERGSCDEGEGAFKLTLYLQRTIQATPQAAYDAFTQPEQLSRWFTTSAAAELKVGGRYANADGDQGEFLALDPPRRVEFTWENAEHCPGTLVAVTFAMINDDEVRVQIRHSQLASQSDYADMKTGWSWALDSLKSYLETGEPIAFDAWQEQRKQASPQPAGSNIFSPPRQLGLALGLVGVLVLVALDVVFLLLLPQPPLGLMNFVWGLLFVLTLPVIGLLVWRTYGLVTASYSLTTNSLTLRWGARREVIPLDAIKEILPGKEVETQLQPKGLWWPGCVVGKLPTEGLGEMDFMATSGQPGQLYVVVEGGTFVISPDRPDEFVAAFAAAKSAERSEEAEPALRESIRSAFADWSVWRDRWGWGLLGASTIGVAALFAYVLAMLPSLPASMALHFAPDGTPDRSGAPHGLLILPFIGMLTLVVNAALGIVAYVRADQKAAAYLLWGTSVLVQVLAWIAVLGLIARA